MLIRRGDSVRYHGGAHDGCGRVGTVSDPGYILTRRKGRRVIISRLIASAVDPTTGERSSTRATTAALAVVEPTRYARRMSSRECSEDVGKTTVLLYTRDLPFDRLSARDVVIVEDRRLAVVGCAIEDTILRVTAREQVGLS
jgi:hypothetical protein